MRKILLIGGVSAGRLGIFRKLAELNNMQIVVAEQAKQSECDRIMLNGYSISGSFIDEIGSIDILSVEKKHGWHGLNKRHISKKKRRKL